MTTPCKSCGAPLEWAAIGEKRVPLDSRAPCYRRERNDRGGIEWSRDRDSFVSHFATCPNANEHSRKGRELIERLQRALSGCLSQLDCHGIEVPLDARELQRELHGDC